jgi:hypothetical protein
MSATTKTIRRNPMPEVVDTSRDALRAPFSQHVYRPDLVRSLIEYLEQIARRLWLSPCGASRSRAPGVRDEH